MSITSSIEKNVVGKFLKNNGITGTMLFGWGMNAAFGVMTYNDEREKGHGVLRSAASAIGTNVMMDVVGLPAFMGLQAIQAAPKLITGGIMDLSRYSRSLAATGRNTPFINQSFNDSAQAFTMRQAGMQLAKASKYNLQQAMLGNEAQYMHL